MNKVALCGLAGVAKKEVEVEFFRSISGGMRLLKRDGATTAAGDEGAINLWRADSGEYHAEMMRHCITQSVCLATTFKETKEWLTIWFPKIKR